MEQQLGSRREVDIEEEEGYSFSEATAKAEALVSGFIL